MKAFRDIRVIPVVLVAIVGLAVLKIAGLAIDGGYVFDYQAAPAKPASKPSWAQQNLGYPGGRDSSDITGSVPARKKEPEKPVIAAPEAAKPAAVAVATEPAPVSASERAVLERLQARRQELEARAREVDIRESLLKATEKRIESRAEEIKGVEARITTLNGAKSEAEAARFKSIVTMYEGMKPKDAARVFDRLEMPVLIEIASQIAPRKMSDILGLMLPEAAERLTVELARRASGDRSAAVVDLPKIDGRPNR